MISMAIENWVQALPVELWVEVALQSDPFDVLTLSKVHEELSIKLNHSNVLF